MEQQATHEAPLTTADIVAGLARIWAEQARRNAEARRREREAGAA